MSSDHAERKWSYPAHTKAKHQLLGRYLDAWFPIIAWLNGKVIFFDGFAGRGRYTDGSEGSPLIALRHLLEHSYWPKMAHREFVFFFVEQDSDNAASLEREIAAFKDAHQPWPPGVTTQVINDTFDRTATSVLDNLRAVGGRLAPTFAFIDPFGYSGLPMRLIGDLLASRKTEVFVNFMVGHVQRFIEREGQEHVMSELFGIDEHELSDALRIPDGVARVEQLRSVYERQLREVARFKYVRSFEMVNNSGNVSYYLFHGTRHREGVKAMKAAMWSVDRREGFQFSDRTAGEITLFESEPNLRPLREEILRHFSGQKNVLVDKIEWYTILETPYRETHVRPVLRPLEREGVITVDRLGRRQYPAGTTVDFP